MKSLLYTLIVAILVSMIIIYSPKLAGAANPMDIPILVFRSAEKYDVNPGVMFKTLECESGYRTDAVGDHGTSFGIAQIHLPAHPDITKEQAFDPDFSIDFMGKEMGKGNAWKWTCFKINFKKGDEYSYPQEQWTHIELRDILHFERGRILKA